MRCYVVFYKPQYGERCYSLAEPTGLGSSCAQPVRQELKSELSVIPPIYRALLGKKETPRKERPHKYADSAAYFSTRQSIGGISFSIKNLFTLENTREPKNPL